MGSNGTLSAKLNELDENMRNHFNQSFVNEKLAIRIDKIKVIAKNAFMGSQVTTAIWSQPTLHAFLCKNRFVIRDSTNLKQDYLGVKSFNDLSNKSKEELHS